jgi:hypothetical protein
LPPFFLALELFSVCQEPAWLLNEFKERHKSLWCRWAPPKTTNIVEFKHGWLDICWTVVGSDLFT